MTYEKYGTANMAEYSSRGDQLWCMALQLAEEEMKSIPFAQEEGNFLNNSFQ